MVAREGSGLKVVENMGSADVLVLESSSMVLVAAYVVWGRECWEKFADRSLHKQVEEILTALRGETRRVLPLGDLNVRTVSLGTRPVGQRISEDGTTTV